TIHPTKALRHTVERGEVADRVIGGNINAHFTRRCANEVNSLLLRLNRGVGKKTSKDCVLGRKPISFQSAQRARQNLKLIVGHVGFYWLQAEWLFFFALATSA